MKKEDKTPAKSKKAPVNEKKESVADLEDEVKRPSKRMKIDHEE